MNLLLGLTKAAVSIVATPVALVIDTALVPSKLASDDPNVKIFGATEACLKSAEQGVKDASK